MDLYSNFLLKTLLLGIVITFSACSSKSNDPKPEEIAPTTYEFTRDGVSSVSYGGQLARLAQVAELKSKVATAEGSNPQKVSYDDLWEMFTNKEGAGSSLFSSSEAKTSGKQVGNKIYQNDVSFFKSLFKDLQAVSGTTNQAEKGKAGLSTRSSGKRILLDKKGHEYVQFTEKMLMGSLMYYQMTAVYLSNAKTGDAIDNKDLIEKNGLKYTKLEHGWDEIFGYFGAPNNFPTSKGKYWAKYSGVVNGQLATSQKIMNAFIKGRFAIAKKDNATKNAQKEILYTELEKVVAGTAIHYLNSSIKALGNGRKGNGDYFHSLSEAYCFVNALKYSPKTKASASEVATYLKTIEDFWTVSSSDLESVRNKISAKYGMDAIRGDL